MGESDPTVRNRQNLCDWILGFHTGEVKAKKVRVGESAKKPQSKEIAGRAGFAPDVQNLWESVRRGPPFWSKILESLGLLLVYLRRRTFFQPQDDHRR